MINQDIQPTDTRFWGLRVRDPEIVRVKHEDGKNRFQVWQDYALIDTFKSRQGAKALVKTLEKLNAEWDEATRTN